MINGSVVAEEGTPSEMRVEIFAQQVIEAVKVIESEVPQELFGKKADFTYTLILPTDVERVMNGNSTFGPTPEGDKIEITVACEAPIPTGELAPQSVPIPRKTRRQLLDVNDWICTGKRLTSVHEQVVEAVARQRPDLRHTACVQRPYGVEITVGSLEFETRSKDQSPASMRTWFPRIPRVRYSVLYFSGRYVKHTRNLSQTPWFLPNGNRIGLDSLEEILMRPLLELCFSSPGESQTRYTRRRCLTERTTTHMKWRQRRQCNAEHPVDACNRMLDENPADSSEIATFASSGREDIDVRMLGEGRPFVIQIFGAARVPTKEELLNVKKSLDDLDVQLTDLRHADQTCMKELQEGEEQKKKSYRCVVWSKRALQPDDVHFVRLNQCTSEHPIVIEQWTPVRVLHRRSLLKRERVIHHVHLTWINWHWILVDLTTSAGTYVKEFIGGDHGRTTPSLGDLLHSCCDIIQLDVMGIECGGGEALPEQ